MIKLSEVSSQRGAPMGRSETHENDQASDFELERLPLQDGCYDAGGAYWGAPDNLYIARAEGVEMFLRADSREEAEKQVRERYESATFKAPELTPFLEAYIEAALWSSTDEEGEPLDANYSIHDLTPEALAQMKSDCEDFETANAADLTLAYSKEWYGRSHAGHDFWFTRNRHGCGFWDRGLGDIGTRLTEMAHPYGSVDLYVTDDGKVGC